MTNNNFYKPNYNLEKIELEQFLLEYQSNLIDKDKLHGKKKYMIELQRISNGISKVLQINFEDLETFFNKNPKLVVSIKENTKRYIGLISEIVDKIMPSRNLIVYNQAAPTNVEDIFMAHRYYNLICQLNSNTDTMTHTDFNWADFSKEEKERLRTRLPAEMYRKYQITFAYENTKSNYSNMRDIKAEEIGSFVSLKAIVVRISEVRPFIKIATYACEECGNEVYQEISGRNFMPLVDCISDICKNNKSRGKIFLNTRSSKFVNFQEIKIQEPPEQVPIGHVPRSISVFAYGSNVNQCTAGDAIVVNGVFLPNVLSGNLRNYKSKLIHDTYIESFQIIKLKSNMIRPKDIGFTKSEFEELKEFKEKKNKKEDWYSRIANSIAPEIFGNSDVKKAILLQLVGGDTKTLKDGLKIRGRVNILLMGDPGVAKSQLLKYVCNLSSRGVYTTGKGSSGVGLTAAVIKDPITNDFMLEGGALVMADNGICCIDEFDKMSDYDRANIYEVMEQQTISIAKAGITTRLNARTSILAAANPVKGRWDKSLSPYENINLPAALLSRFDVVFLLLDDKENRKYDNDLASHILNVHQTKGVSVEYKNALSRDFVRKYIEESKKYNPSIPKKLHNFIVQKYVEKRREDKEESQGIKKDGHQYVTPRSLLAIIRLSQSLARLRLSNEVEQIDIDEAIRLSECSRNSVNNVEEEKQTKKSKNIDETLFLILRRIAEENANDVIKMKDFEKKAISIGSVNREAIQRFLTTYKNLNIIHLNENNEIILI